MVLRSRVEGLGLSGFLVRLRASDLGFEGVHGFRGLWLSSSDIGG